MASIVDLQSEKSRQKSCNACVRSKRRCDKQTPRCTRCAEKNTDCVYQNLPSGNSSAAVDDSEDSASMEVDPPDTQEANCTSTTATKTTDFELDFGAAPPLDSFESLLMSSTTSSSSNNSNSNLSMDLPFEYSPLSFLQDAMGMDLGHLGLEPWQAVAPPKEIQPPVLRVTSSSLTLDMEACRQNACDFNVWELYEPNNRLAKAVNYMTNFHATFAREREATCIHRHLYKTTMPDSIHRAFMAAVMYANRTTANKSWVFRLLVENCAALVHTEAHTPLEKLARTQALFIYQTIRMFDGDLTLRAQSQKQMPIFLKWIQELVELRDNLDDMTLLDSMAINSRPPKSWEKWIFNECVRRTIVTGYAFASMTTMMLQEGDQEGAWDYWEQTHRWTISQALWKADSPMAFFSAWRDQPQYIIENFEVSQFIRLGKVEEVDDFVLVVLYVTSGNEAADQLAMAGEALIARQRAIV